MLSSPAGDQVVGVTSWGPSDCNKPYSFYTRVADHLDWVQAKVALGVPAAPTTPARPGSGSARGSSNLVEDAMAALAQAVQDVLAAAAGKQAAT